MTLRSLSFSLLACAAGFLAGCSHSTDAQPGQFLHRQGDEIVVCGQLVHTGAPVVTWMDPGGYDAYRVERRFAPLDDSDWRHSTAEVKELKTPNRYGLRKAGLTPAQLEQVPRRRVASGSFAGEG
jgi:N-acetylmuramoyl-L-alanine amidase